MEAVLATCICGLFGAWVWNLKMEVVGLQRRVVPEGMPMAVPRPRAAPAPEHKSAPEKAPPPTETPRTPKVRTEDGIQTWMINE